MSPGTRTSSFLALLVPSKASLCIALIGGGGKTALLHQLGAELVADSSSRPVLLTSLTRMLKNSEIEPITIDHVREKGIRELQRRFNPLTILGTQVSDEKLSGITDDVLSDLLPHFGACVFECDGARGLPLKAHNLRDPMVPEFVDQVIVVVGADIVGTRIGDGLVHRADAFCQKWSVSPDAFLDAIFVAEVVTSANGYHEKIPPTIPVSYFVNKADDCFEQAVLLGKAIARTTESAVWIGSIQHGWLEQVQ